MFVLFTFVFQLSVLEDGDIFQILVGIVHASMT